MKSTQTSWISDCRWLAARLCALLAGCQQKMAVQPSLKPMMASDFFPHGSSRCGCRSRGPWLVGICTSTVSSTVGGPRPITVRGRPQTNVRIEAAEPSAQATVSAEAAANDNVVTEFPLPVTRELLEHGRNRYMIYCVVCHDALGTGHGKIVERGYTRPPSYHMQRLRDAPVGHLFVVVSEGYGSMPSYRGQISARDRWAIVAYIRALQLSQRFPQDKLPEEMRQAWDRSQQVAAQEVPSR